MAVTEEELTEVEDRWKGVLIIEGERTTDLREIAEGALSWRELPMPLHREVVTSHGGVPMNQVVLVGSIESIERVGNEIHAEGSFDMGSPEGREAARVVTGQVQRWLSGDVEMEEFELIEEGNCDSDQEFDEYVANCKMIERTTKGRIMGVTIVGHSAFPGTVIVPASQEIPAATENGRASVVASGFEAAVKPPKEWFEDPKLDGPTPLTITADGRVYGHAATWDTCHTGRADVCLVPPHSESGYAYFRTGAVVCDDATSIPTGRLTLGTGHAELSLGHNAAAEHYDHTGAAVADVAAGEDEYGIWLAGRVRPGVDEERLQALRASAVSGDWRVIGGALELVAVLAVNVPGYPVKRMAHVASGVQTALVGSAAPRKTDETDERIENLEAQIKQLWSIAKPLRKQAQQAIVASVRGRDVSDKTIEGLKADIERAKNIYPPPHWSITEPLTKPKATGK